MLGVHPQNTTAIHLYEKLGFTRLGWNSNFIKMEIVTDKYNELYGYNR